MRFMVIVRANEDSEAGKMPSEEMLTAMGNYNEELVRAGVMLAAEGLHPSSARAPACAFSGNGRDVIDGPFAEARELIAGFWLIQVRSLGEAIEMGQARTQSIRGRIRDRDSPHLRGRGFRRRVHTRSARPGRTPARRARLTPLTHDRRSSS